MKEAIIVDLDGTLADCDHRLHYIQQKHKDFGAFYEAMGDDEMDGDVHTLIWNYWRDFDCEILVVTGRPEKYRTKTDKWFSDMCNSYDKLFMRKDGDFRPDYEVKKEIYEKNIKSKYNVHLVLEDRTKVVKMWRSLGLKCWQVKDGDY